jgi:hypothetical protein
MIKFSLKVNARMQRTVKLRLDFSNKQWPMEKNTLLEDLNLK